MIQGAKQFIETHNIPKHQILSETENAVRFFTFVPYKKESFRDTNSSLRIEYEIIETDGLGVVFLNTDDIIVFSDFNTYMIKNRLNIINKKYNVNVAYIENNAVRLKMQSPLVTSNLLAEAANDFYYVASSLINEVYNDLKYIK